MNVPSRAPVKRPISRRHYLSSRPPGTAQSEVMSFPPLVNMADLVLSFLSRSQARGGLSTIRLSTIGRKATWGPVEDTAALKACSRCFALASGNPRFLAALAGNFRRIEDPAQGIMGQRWPLSGRGIGLFETVRASSGRAGVSKSGAEGPECCAW